MAGYGTESGALENVRPMIDDPYGEWSKLQQYFGMAATLQGYYDSVSKDIEEAQSQPNYKSSKELQDYVSGLLKTIKKVREQYGGSSVATPGINPNAQTSGTFEGSPYDTSNIVQESRDRFEGSPAGQASSGIADWLGDKLQNGGFILLGIVVIGVAVAFTARKQVVQVVKGAALDAIVG